MKRSELEKIIKNIIMEEMEELEESNPWHKGSDGKFTNRSGAGSFSNWFNPPASNRKKSRSSMPGRRSIKGGPESCGRGRHPDRGTGTHKCSSGEKKWESKGVSNNDATSHIKHEDLLERIKQNIFEYLDGIESDPHCPSLKINKQTNKHADKQTNGSELVEDTQAEDQQQTPYEKFQDYLSRDMAKKREENSLQRAEEKARRLKDFKSREDS